MREDVRYETYADAKVTHCLKAAHQRSIETAGFVRCVKGVLGCRCFWPRAGNRRRNL